MNVQKLIESITLLNTLSAEEIYSYIQKKLFKLVHYEKNRMIHLDGDKCNYLEIILSGKVAVERIGESGDLLTIGAFYTNDILGGNLIFSKNPYYPMTVTAQTKVTLLQIDKKLLFHLCSSNKSFLRNYLELTSDHALLLGDKIKYYVNRSIRESIINYLNHEHLLQNSLTIQLHITKKELAERMGIQRTSLSRELQKMKKEGLLLVTPSCITILDEQILQLGK